MATPFLDFLSSHNKTLKEIELTNCEMVAEVEQGLQHQQYCWSDIFVPFVTTDPLMAIWSLSLSGWFSIDHPTSQDPDQQPIIPYFDMHDTIEDMELFVRDALEMTICLEEFDSFLSKEVAGHEGLTVETIKKGIIQDLLSQPPVRSGRPRMVEIPTEYAKYFQAFTMISDSSLGGRWWWDSSKPPKMPMPELSEAS